MGEGGFDEATDHCSLIFARILLMVSVTSRYRFHVVDLLRIPVECVLILSNLDWATTKLQRSVRTLGTIIKPPQHTCGIKTRSPSEHPIGILFPSLSSPPGPTARTLASFSFSTLLSGRKIPPAVLVSAFIL